MLEGKGKCAKVGHSIIIRLPIYLAVDSRFPFKLNEVVRVRIEGDRVIVEKQPKDELHGEKELSGNIRVAMS